VEWSGNRTLANGVGDDLLVLESGFKDGGPEAFMVRVRVSGQAVPLAWHYQPASTFQFDPRQEAHPSSQGGTGTYATLLDLSDLGVPTGGMIDRVEVANLLVTDRIKGVGAFAQGEVELHPVGSDLLKPDPGAAAPWNEFPSDKFDPDVLYLGVLRAVQ